MAGRKKAKAAKVAKTKKKGVFDDLLLHNPEDWVLLVLGSVGFANLVPKISATMGTPLTYTWPIIVVVIGIKKLIDRWSKD